MNLLLRLAWFAITCGYKPAIGLHQEVKKHFRVLPTDLDVNGHMTNSRYLAIMDLASLELLVRAGLLKRVLKKRWRPVLGGTLTSHRRALKPFDRYTVQTQAIYWDQCWSYLEHRFERDGEVVAVALSKVVFLSSQGMMPVLEVMGELATTPPALPEPVRLWLEAEEQLTSCMAGACIEAGRIGAARSESENLGQSHSIEEGAVCSFG
ncbi:MAG: thioesterase family protein [Chromatiales bacterium]